MDPIDLAKIEDLPHGADRFFRTCIRFEYALKACGYASGNGRVQADWNQFARSLGDEFFKAVVASGRATTTLQNPAKRQVLRGGTLEFESTLPPSNVQQLFEAIRMARNNLLHGGKHGDPDADRNESLISEAQWILEHALRQNSTVRGEFEANY